jgi:uncharacterized repeat protein (TIGR01451 family)
VVTGVTATKAITALADPVVAYRITLTNAGPFPQLDNPGPELVDLLPAQLTLIQAVASSGVLILAPTSVTWNGEIPVGDTVTIDVEADFAAAPIPSLICNSATLFTDSTGDGVNDLQVPSDDPNRPGTADSTCFALPLDGVNIATLGPAGLALLALLLAGVGVALLRRRKEVYR